MSHACCCVCVPLLCAQGIFKHEGFTGFYRVIINNSSSSTHSLYSHLVLLLCPGPRVQAAADCTDLSPVVPYAHQPYTCLDCDGQQADAAHGCCMTSMHCAI